MADLNGGKGKFWGVDSSVTYDVSFKGATKVAEKVKKGGTENTPDGYVVDAIDIDWGGLKLTTIDNGWSQNTVSSSEQNAGKGENTRGIHSTAYLLNLISSSFDQIYNQIGGSDNAGLRKRIAGAEASIKAMTDLSTTELTGIQNDLRLIKEELAGEPVNTWTTLVDKLAYLGDDTVVKYVNNAVAGAKREAINAAASDATSKANTAKTEAIKAAASDAAAKDEQVKIDLIGKSSDAVTADTIWGAKNYANTTVKNSLLGATDDQWSTTKQTIWGAKNYADGVKTASYNQAKFEAGNVLGKPIDAATDNTVYGVRKYVEEKAETSYTNAVTKANEYTNHAIGTAESTLIGTASDHADSNTIWGAKNYAKVQISVTKYNQLTAQVIEENGEGILNFLTVSSYLG